MWLTFENCHLTFLKEYPFSRERELNELLMQLSHKQLTKLLQRQQGVASWKTIF